MNLGQFLDRYRDAVTAAVIRTYPPVYDAETRRTSGFDLRRLLRRPLGGQADAIRATALSLQRQRGTNLVGEMGCGKSLVAASAAYLAGLRRVLVVCPPHLVRKWRREIVQTVPGAQVALVRTITDLERARPLTGRATFVVCSREQAKLGYRWIPAAVTRLARDADGRLARDDAGRALRLLCCPACYAAALDDEEVPLTWADLATKKQRCRACGDPLWQADRTGPRRFPLADYIRRRLPRHFELLIADEVQDFKARGSAQGLAVGALAEVCERTLTLTGTLFGGYSSTLFYLLWRFSPEVRAEFGYRDEPKWVSRYGVVERITKKDADAHLDDGRQSKRRTYLTRTIEKPGVSPAVLLHLIGNSIFLRLADVSQDLPPYQERVILYPLDERPLADGVSQADAYQRLANDLRQAVREALQRGSKRLLGAYLQALLGYPDASTRGETVLDPTSGEVLAAAPALPDDVLFPKEQALVELVRRERERNRRVLVFITHTERRDLSPRLTAILEREGFRPAVLKAGTTSAERREEWVAARVREGADVLICHPRLVQTGLDLIDWPSIVWFQPEYSVYVLRQASRRSWRIGQRQPVEVSYLVYASTLQAEALALVAAKMRSALMVDGELPEEGLAALEGDGQDLLLALARRLAEGGAGEGQSLETLFADARRTEDAADEFLVAGSWDGAVEPDREFLPIAYQHGPLVDGSLGGLPLFNTAVTLTQPEPSPSTGKVVTFAEFAHLLRRPKLRRRVPPEGQLALFGP